MKSRHTVEWQEQKLLKFVLFFVYDKFLGDEMEPQYLETQRIDKTEVFNSFPFSCLWYLW